MAINLFIDTNVLLSFYHFTSDDLEELNKLVAVLRAGEARLLVTTQVVDELKRNREVKIADALKQLATQKLPTGFPQLCKGYPEYAPLRSHLAGYEAERAKLIERITADALAEQLKADHLIAELLKSATELTIDATTVGRARLRVDRGNPPGKGGSLGDAINWEALLAYAIKIEPLHLITDDRDYMSALPGASLAPFLVAEWRRHHPGDLIHHAQLSDFFRKEFPQIKLAREAQKDLLIANLARSGSFAETHSLVAKLEAFPEFTNEQSNAILMGSMANGQVYAILCDHDVRSFLTRVAQGRGDRMDADSIQLLEERIARLDVALPGSEERADAD